MIGQTIRLKVKAGMESEFETLVAQLMRDVVSSEPGSIYDIRRIKALSPLRQRTYSKPPRLSELIQNVRA